MSTSTTRRAPSDPGLLFLTGVMIVSAMFVGSAHAQDKGSPDVPIPSEVTGHIQARNFIVAFSLPQERMKLADYESAEAVWRDTWSPRLRIVFKKMEKLRALKTATDPDMVYREDSSRAQVPPSLFPPSLLKIARVARREQRRLVVVVTAHPLSLDATRRLISKYDVREWSPDRFEEVLTPASHREVHTWIRSGKVWRKEEAEFRYLEAR